MIFDIIFGILLPISFVVFDQINYHIHHHNRPGNCLIFGEYTTLAYSFLTLDALGLIGYLSLAAKLRKQTDFLSGILFAGALGWLIPGFWMLSWGVLLTGIILLRGPIELTPGGKQIGLAAGLLSTLFSTTFFLISFATLRNGVRVFSLARENPNNRLMVSVMTGFATVLMIMGFSQWEVNQIVSTSVHQIRYGDAEAKQAGKMSLKMVLWVNLIDPCEAFFSIKEDRNFATAYKDITGKDINEECPTYID